MKHADGWIHFSLFYAGIIGPVDVRPVRHIFLGQFLSLTDGNNSQTESSVKEVTVHNEKNIQYRADTCLMLIHNKSGILAYYKKIFLTIVLLPQRA